MADFISWIINSAFAVLGLSLVLAAGRLLWGPSLADRVVALDLIAYLIIAVSALFALKTGRFGYLTVALVVGLFVFIGTIAFARHIERTAAPGEEQ